MNRQDVCILLNSTPKYYYLLHLQVVLLRRYAPFLQWPVYFATEVPEHPIPKQLESELNVKILSLPMEREGFLESRETALRMLPPEILYVLPLQEDFLLDRAPDERALADALFILDTDRTVSSLRLMPCPGPFDDDPLYVNEKPWKILGQKDVYIFTYQATLWRKYDITTYFSSLLAAIEKEFKMAKQKDKKYLALTMNLGETGYGQKILKTCLQNTLHLAWPRMHKHANAVYLCPWPYRPTAVKRGQLEQFAEELFLREGIKFERPTQNMLT